MVPKREVDYLYCYFLLCIEHLRPQEQHSVMIRDGIGQTRQDRMKSFSDFKSSKYIICSENKIMFTCSLTPITIQIL